MTMPLCLAGFVLPRALRFGALRLTPYGLCAALGLMLAMTLSRGAAPKRQLHPESVWDAGVVAIVSCLVISRLLLVLRDPKAFVRYPVLLLSLPSLTFGGMALGAVLVWLYLRRMHMALLPTLDVFAAPACALAALLELGHWLDGSEVGMPTAVPWAVRDPWSVAVVRVHPVALYGIFLAALLCFALWRWLPKLQRVGRVAALGLMLGGLTAFGLDLLTQPLALMEDPSLEPGQWVALSAMLAGALLWTFVPASADAAQPRSPRDGASAEMQEPEPVNQAAELFAEVR